MMGCKVYIYIYDIYDAGYGTDMLHCCIHPLLLPLRADRGGKGAAFDKLKTKVGMRDNLDISCFRMIMAYVVGCGIERKK